MKSGKWCIRSFNIYHKKKVFIILEKKFKLKKKNSKQKLYFYICLEYNKAEQILKKFSGNK
jgi:hypothetical protein